MRLNLVDEECEHRDGDNDHAQELSVKAIVVFQIVVLGF